MESPAFISIKAAFKSKKKKKTQTNEMKVKINLNNLVRKNEHFFYSC